MSVEFGKRVEIHPFSRSLRWAVDNIRFVLDNNARLADAEVSPERTREHADLDTRRKPLNAEDAALVAFLKYGNRSRVLEGLPILESSKEHLPRMPHPEEVFKSLQGQSTEYHGMSGAYNH